MDGIAQQVFDDLSGCGDVYAVLDGARDRSIRRFTLDSRAPAWCLWRGDLPGPMQDAAPYLLKLQRGAEYTERFFAVGWNNAWGVLLATHATSRALRRHLRQFFRVRTGEGRVLLFRYYDPRVLRVFLPALDERRAAEFFGEVNAFAAEPETGDAPLVFRRAGPAKAALLAGLWTIPGNAMAALEQAARDRFHGQMRDRLSKAFPEKASSLGASGLADAVASGVESAASHRILAEEDIARFLHCWFQTDFELEKRWPWATEILRNPKLDATAKLDFIEATNG